MFTSVPPLTSPLAFFGPLAPLPQGKHLLFLRVQLFLFPLPLSSAWVCNTEMERLFTFTYSTFFPPFPWPSCPRAPPPFVTGRYYHSFAPRWEAFKVVFCAAPASATLLPPCASCVQRPTSPSEFFTSPLCVDLSPYRAFFLLPSSLMVTFPFFPRMTPQRGRVQYPITPPV